MLSNIDILMFYEININHTGIILITYLFILKVAVSIIF